MTLRDHLRDIANTPGYGTGKRYLDRLAAEAECAALLPDPLAISPVMASTDPANNFPIACFGNSDQDWFLVSEDAPDGFMQHACLPSDAESDARTIAAIVNAYRLGVLVRRDV